ncbi:MAG TPA: hypothetical protein DHV26_03705 [Cytophagales bacterium]|nr:hypothetical protein [Cytophagales bacterium]HRG07124.1 hypothetical protein [Cyclobacteriaceae bacterium]
MDIAVKKIELIEWLTRLQDEKLIKKIEALKKDSVTDHYEQRTPKDLQQLTQKLKQSEQDILSGNVHSQDSVENYFKTKFNQ